MSKKTVLVLILILGAAFSRFIPHWPNFTAIGAMALFSGAMLKPRFLAILAPLAAMLISDLALGMHNTMIFVYAAVVLITVLGMGFLKDLKLMRWLGGALGASGIFFILTNFGVWAAGGLYEKTAQGLGMSYIMALPFLTNQILGDLFYTALLLGTAAVLANFEGRSSSKLQRPS